MPGIVGIIGMNCNLELKALFKNMCLAIRHEDCYLVDEYINSHVAIGRVHLGIFCPEPQPVFNKNCTLCVFMDGEIYEYNKELQKNENRFENDHGPEIILHLYTKYGLDFTKHFKGIFNVVIWDSSQQKLIIANDRYGFKPLYYAHSNGSLLFGSEVKAILEDKKFKRTVNRNAIADFFSYGYHFGDKTFFEGINLMPPGSIMIFQNGEINFQQYWDFAYAEEYSDTSEEMLVEEFHFLLKKAVERQMRSEHRIAIPLSGGLDSRTIVAMVDKAHYPINTITFGRHECNDNKFAKRVAKDLGMDHHFLELIPKNMQTCFERSIELTDGMCNVFDCHETSLLDSYKNYGDIILDGLSGAILLSSHISEEMIRSNENYASDMFYNNFGNLYIRQSNLFQSPTWQEIEESARSSFYTAVQNARKSNSIICNIADHIDQRNEQRRFLLNGPILCGSRLGVRLPFCDYDLTDFMLSLPPHLRYGKYLLIKLMKIKYPSLADIPWQRTGLPLHSSEKLQKIRSKYHWLSCKMGRALEMLTRCKISPKCAFTYANYAAWLRSDFREFVQDILLDSTTLQRGYYNPLTLRKLLADHMSGRKNNFYLIGHLLTFELWNRKCIDDQKN